MDNIRQFPDSRVIDEEAAVWLARLDADQPLDQQEKADLTEWLGRSPLHRRSLSSLNKFWSNNILTELMMPLGRHERPHTRLFRWSLNLFAWLGVGAAVAGALLLVLPQFISIEAPFEANGLYVTAVGQQKTLILEDGSRIQLNTNSQLEVDYGVQYRNLRLLQGEAFFEVAKNPDRPFRVYAGSNRVQAVGTAFNVRLINAQTNVLVSEGRVALAVLGEPLTSDEPISESDIDSYVKSKTRDLGTLDAGQSLTFGGANIAAFTQREILDEIDILDESELSQRQSWKDGLLIFSGEPLEQVVAEISRYTTVSIDIVDPTLKDMQIGGRFRVGEIDDMFAALETNFGIRVDRITYNQIELRAAN